MTLIDDTFFLCCRKCTYYVFVAGGGTRITDSIYSFNFIVKFPIVFAIISSIFVIPGLYLSTKFHRNR